MLLTVACIGLGWFSRQLWIVRHRRAMLTQLEVNYWASAAFDDRKWHQNEIRGMTLIHQKDPTFRLGELRRWLGDRYVNQLYVPQWMPPSDRYQLDVFPEADVYGKLDPK